MDYLLWPFCSLAVAFKFKLTGEHLSSLAAALVLPMETSPPIFSLCQAEKGASVTGTSLFIWPSLSLFPEKLWNTEWSMAWACDYKSLDSKLCKKASTEGLKDYLVITLSLEKCLPCEWVLSHKAVSQPSSRVPLLLATNMGNASLKVNTFRCSFKYPWPMVYFSWLLDPSIPGLPCWIIFLCTSSFRFPGLAIVPFSTLNESFLSSAWEFASSPRCG